MGNIVKSYAQIAEGQLHCRRNTGSREGLPLVLLHASPASSSFTEPLMQALGDARSLIAFDNPCNGQSCSPSVSAPTVTDFADLLERGCESLGLERIALYGTHTGAHFAIRWALDHPDRIAVLILDGVALFEDNIRTEFLEHYAPRRVPEADGGQFHWAWQFIRDQMIFFPHYRKDSAHLRAGGTFEPETLHRLTLDVLANLETYHMPYEAVFRHDVRSDLSQLELPVLVFSDVEGPLDPTFSELCSLVPHARQGLKCADTAAKAAAINGFLEEFS